MKWTESEISFLLLHGLEYGRAPEYAERLGRSEKSVESKIYWLKAKRNNLVVTRC